MSDLKSIDRLKLFRTDEELDYLDQLEIAGNKVTKWIQKNPKASMWIMIVLAILNLL